MATLQKQLQPSDLCQFSLRVDVVVQFDPEMAHPKIPRTFPVGGDPDEVMGNGNHVERVLKLCVEKFASSAKIFGVYLTGKRSFGRSPFIALKERDFI